MRITRPQILLRLLALWVLTNTQANASQDESATSEPRPRFRHHVIDAQVPGTHWSMLVIADLDGDGLDDVVLGQSRWAKDSSHPVRWYRNTGSIDRWDEPIAVVEGIVTDCGLAATDVDGDSHIDLVSSVDWFRNPGRIAQGTRFERFVFDPDLEAQERFNVHDVLAVDLDGDGRDEIVTNGDAQNYDGLFVYRIGSDPCSPWERMRLDDVGAVHAAISPRGVGDLNADGRPDIVYIDRWFENGEDGASWTPHRNLDFGREGPWGVGARTWIADLDRDGHPDVVQSNCDVPEARVVWFANVDGDGSRWVKHLLPDEGTTGDFHSLAVGDFDLDGDLDVYVDEMEHIHPPDRGPGSRFGKILWENRDGRGLEWTKHTLVEGYGGHEARIADLDGDGDLDIVTKPYTAGPNANGGRVHLSILENLAAPE